MNNKLSISLITITGLSTMILSFFIEFYGFSEQGIIFFILGVCLILVVYVSNEINFRRRIKELKNEEMMRSKEI